MSRSERSNKLKVDGDRIPDSIFRNWTPSRWAQRLKMDTKFLLKDGKLSVLSSGIYFVYAQVRLMYSNVDF